MFNLTKWDGDYPSTWSSNHITTFSTLKELCKKHNAYIAGGAARSLVNGEVSDDFDIYTCNDGFSESAMDLSVALQRLGPSHSKNGVPTYNVNGVEVQYINFKTGDPQQVISTFDFTCCQVATNGDWLIQSDEAIEDIHKKKLRWTNEALTAPVNLLSRFWRIQKYLKKGYTFADGEADKYFKMSWAQEFEHVQSNGVRNLGSHSDTRDFGMVLPPTAPPRLVYGDGGAGGGSLSNYGDSRGMIASSSSGRRAIPMSAPTRSGDESISF